MITNYRVCLAIAVALPLFVSCSKQAATPANAPHEHHDGETTEEHASADQHDADHDHHDHEHPTEESVKTPESFAAGVTRLTELHQKIAHLIEENKLDDVHHAAEEMSIVARKMKPLSLRDIAEEKRTDAGRLCNDVAAFFTPIDEAADAGKKAETIAIHKQMAETIAKLEALSKK